MSSDEECGLDSEALPKPKPLGQITIEGTTYDKYYGSPLGRHQCFYNSIVSSMKINNDVSMSITELKQKMVDAIISSKGRLKDLAEMRSEEIHKQEIDKDVENLFSYSAMNNMEEPGVKVSEAIDARVFIHHKGWNGKIFTDVNVPKDNPDPDIEIHLLYVNGNHYDFLIPTKTNPLNENLQ